MLINQEVKGQLAKLLATENLTIEHRKVTTAYFDVEKRILCLPIWKSASNTVYDLLVGHEVGHALFTPADKLNGADRSFVNVLEDARIERMMKVKYPGLRNTFFKGYQELWNDGFFGVSDDDIEQLSLIDRMNLFFKGNSSLDFDSEEQVWVDRAATTKTFQDVLDLARDMMDRAEQKDQEKVDETELPEIPFNGEKDGDGEYELGEKQPAPKGQGEDGDSQGSPDRREDETDFDDDYEDEGLDYDTQTTGEQIGGGTTLGTDFTTVKETECVTEEALAESIETLVDEDSREWVYLSLPKIKDINKVIIGHKKIQEDLIQHFDDEYNKDLDPTENSDWRQHQIKEQKAAIDFSKDHYLKFKKSTGKTVNYLLKQFEMKKSADQYKRQATSKTGVINTQSLYKYKLTEDIFKKITVIPDGKNHGLVMFLDWSGSMSQCLLDTLKQTYNLVWFCKKANIPFRVYGFQSGYHSSYRFGSYLHEGFEHQEHQLAVGDDFRLLEFLSSRQNNRSLESSMKALYMQVFSMNNYNIKGCEQYGLGGTPLAEAIYCAKTIVAQMKAQEKVQKVNVVCLTDGEANPMNYTTRQSWDEDDDRLRSRNVCSSSHVFVLRDKATGYQKRLNGSPYLTTKEIVSYMRSITDYNWIGIRLCSKSEVNRVIRNITDNFDDIQKYDKLWKKEKFISIVDDAGFNEAFFMPDRNNGSDSEELEIKQKGVEATRAELNRAFKKHMSSKMQNKTILNRFIAQIA
ncbi:hypothetical protein CPQG_00172 [Cyanophage P-RSM3]|uniref:Peptidase n=3 Tax=Ronodorvirus ssm4 TaxID=2845939 RepID=M1PRA1_9CAUD|nr:peptidase [Prochlorococcus phage P-SSM4]AAX46923.1 peptidase [Prochlorococcus phage P-SSM4]AGF91469.1 hypothetical protein CPYG_00175 [Cyanophage P-SS1]AGH26699.1 hypothetical protein CPQG_00172 [Cyanophage P-RSM3]